MASNQARVVFTVGGREFTVKAKNLRGVIKAMDRLYPGEHLEEETTVAIDGAIHETAYFQPIREGCEVYFILEGGYQDPDSISLAVTPVMPQPPEWARIVANRWISLFGLHRRADPTYCKLAGPVMGVPLLVRDELPQNRRTFMLIESYRLPK
jgi:sulfur-carrier protein